MKMDLIRPCADCPFRTDIRPYLRPRRVQEITGALLYAGSAFSCHKTNDYDEDGAPVEHDNSQHCAGAMIFLRHQDRPNQVMQVAERLKIHDPTRLDMEAPVYTGREEMVYRAEKTHAEEKLRAGLHNLVCQIRQSAVLGEEAWAVADELEAILRRTYG